MDRQDSQALKSQFQPTQRLLEVLMQHCIKVALALSAGLLLAGTSSATPIIIQPDAGLAANADALAAFNRAATRWGNLFSDPITVTIAAGFQVMANPNTIGSASSVMLQGGYNTIRNAMVADAADEASNAVAAALPTAAQFTGFLPAGFGFSSSMAATKANLKAMGFGGLDAQFGITDATVTFNSSFSFDFDNSNGVTAGTMDFETVAMHEIGHVLGFVSAVDVVDFFLSTGVTPEPIQLRPLDLFRFGSNDPTTLAEFTTMTRDLRTNVPAFFDDSATVGPSRRVVRPAMAGRPATGRTIA
jgi:hypothetical protein